MTAYPITMYGIRELQPGPRWGQLFDATWPAYQRFYLAEGRAARPSLITAGAALATHMPELLPTWARLSEQTGFDERCLRLLDPLESADLCAGRLQPSGYDGADAGLGS